MKTRCLFPCGLALAVAFLTAPLCATDSSLEGPIQPSWGEAKSEMQQLFAEDASGPPIKIAPREAPLSASGLGVTSSGQAFLFAGHDTVWLLEADMSALMGEP